MKILSVDIVSFGKLNGVNIRFDDGLNVIRQTNGFGKTTLCNFVRAMLFGFSYSRGKNGSDAARWQNWSGPERFGGSMSVEHNGNRYKIERFFGATARRETLSVTDERTGKPVQWSCQPGEALLGLTAESFDRSVYLPQEAVEISSNDNLEARLANLVQNSSEDFEKVQDKLRLYKKNLRYEKGVGGEIARLEGEKYQLQQQLFQAEQAKVRTQQINARLKEIADERIELARRGEEAQRKTAQLSAQAEQTNVSANAAVQQLAETEARIAALGQIQSDMARCDELLRSRAEQTAKPAAKKRLWLFGLFALLAAVGAVAIVLGALDILPIAAGIAVGCVCITMGVASLFFVNGKQRRNVEQKDDAQRQFEQIAGKYVQVSDDFEQTRRALWEVYSRYQADLHTKEALLAVANQPTADASLKEQLDATKQTLASVMQKQNDLLAEEVRITEERKRLVADAVEVMDRLPAVQQAIAQAEHRFAVADAVVRLLNNARDNLSGSYVPRLCARTTQLLQQLTCSDLKLECDRSFNLSLCQNGMTKPMAEFSRGTREITLLCFRVALAELLFDGNVPLLIVDDAFVNFDENNFIRATDLLKKLAEHAQVIYLTCHARTGNLQ